ncbi:hypothetical protein ACFLQI_01990 [Candidatus Undinarchaeota archaeon]
MSRGRPLKSQVRNKIERILDCCGVAYGYEIYKIYKKAYAPTTLRNIYYHLNKGVEEGIFIPVGSEKVSGDYTWGPAVERKNYSLGHNATERADEKLVSVVKVLGIKKKDVVEFVNWKSISKGVWKDFENKMGNAKTRSEKKKVLEEYGRILAWLGKKDTSGLRSKIDKKLETIIE